MVKVFRNFADIFIENQEVNMAKIIENERRIIKLSVEDVINIVREYQVLTRYSCCYEHTREILKKNAIFIPEDI